MTTSGSYNFNPSLGELVIYAFNRCGIRATALLQEHMVDARMSANMVLSSWSGNTPNLWSVDLQTVPLVVGQVAYDVPANTIAMLDAYVTIGTGDEAIDRIILPVSRTEYASYPQKDEIGSVTTFWFDRLLSPSINLFLAPDATQTTLNYYRVRQPMDADFTSGQTVELPYYWLRAFAYAMAADLAISWAPDRAVALQAAADKFYQIAYDQNIENAAIYVSPMISGYYRR